MQNTLIRMDYIGGWIEVDYYEERKRIDLHRSELMTDDEMTCINYLISLLNENRAYMNDFYTRWAEEEEYYGNDQEGKPKKPNSKMNILAATVEGLVTQIVNPNTTIMCQGVSPEDEEFAQWAYIVLDWAFKHNKMHKKASVHEKRRNCFGSAWFKVVWDEDYAGQGIPKVMIPSLNKIFVDQKIKDFTRLEEADYIAETINLSREYARATYGDEKADLIEYGFNQYIDNGVFIEEQSTIDDTGFTLIQWWSKESGKLRLREFTGCGLLLYDSFKPGDRRTQGKWGISIPNQYFKYTNHYPYFLTIKYFSEGKLFGFGDAKLLISPQKMLNELYDKIRIQMRPNINLVDINTNIDISTFDDEDSFSPVPFEGNRVKGNPIWSVPWGQISTDFWKFIESIHAEAQRIARFSDLMTGQQNATATATEAAIQQSQGNNHTEHEKMYLEDTLGDMCQFMLALMMEKFKGNKAFRIPGEQKQFEWVDFQKLISIPVMKPATSAYKEKFRDNNPNVEVPQWEHVTTASGKAVTKTVEMDIEVSVGSGLPKNKAFLWQMIDSLSQKMGIDFSSGQPVQKPIIDYNEVRSFLVDYLGLPLKTKNDFEEFMKQYMKQGEQRSNNAVANASDQNLPINNNFNPEMAGQAFTQQEVPEQAPQPAGQTPMAQTEGMAAKGVGQELNQGIKAGG